MDKDKAEIGKRIRIVRNANNLTQQDMAEVMDISVKHCSEVERGESTYSIQNFIKLCDTFDISLDYIIRGKNNSESDAPVIPQTVIDIMSSNDEEKIKIFLEYLAVFNAINENV